MTAWSLQTFSADDPAGDVQPQPRAAPDRLGREERLPDAELERAGNPGPVVHHLHEHVVAVERRTDGELPPARA